MSRIGIYSGTFDPVHVGHIAFALQALRVSKLDKVFFLPERRPRNKKQVEHFGHRAAMLSRALKPYPEFEVLEMVDISFSVERTLPRLYNKFSDNKLVFLFGSDVAVRLSNWPKADALLKNNEVVIGLRSEHDRETIRSLVENWPIQPPAVTIFDSYAPKVSSSKVREALRRREAADGLLKSVERYNNRHWLYISFEK